MYLLFVIAPAKHIYIAKWTAIAGRFWHIPFLYAIHSNIRDHRRNVYDEGHIAMDGTRTFPRGRQCTMYSGLQSRRMGIRNDRLCEFF